MPRMRPRILGAVPRRERAVLGVREPTRRARPTSPPAESALPLAAERNPRVHAGSARALRRGARSETGAGFVSDFLARLLERGRSTIADARARGPFVTPKPRPAVEAELPTPEASPSPEDPPRVADATQPLAARPPREREQPRRESKAPRLEPSRAEPPIAMPLAPGAEHDWRPGGPESSNTRGPGTPARSAPLRDAGIRATTSASFKPQDRRRPAAPDARRGPVAIQPEQPR